MSEIPETVFKILSLGIIGLAFLLAFMAFRLLQSEQSREGRRGEPDRQPIHKQIKWFMGFSIVLCLLVLAAQFWRPSNYGWEYVGRGDFIDMDVTSTEGSGKPADHLCNNANLGMTAVCWPRSTTSPTTTKTGDGGSCTYKQILARATTRTSSIGEVYRCTTRS